MKAADPALVALRLKRAGDALKELLALLPAPVHRLATELANSGGTCYPTDVDIRDSAAMLLRYAQRANARRAPVVQLATKGRQA